MAVIMDEPFGAELFDADDEARCAVRPQAGDGADDTVGGDLDRRQAGGACSERARARWLAGGKRERGGRGNQLAAREKHARRVGRVAARATRFALGEGSGKRMAVANFTGAGVYLSCRTLAPFATARS